MKSLRVRLREGASGMKFEDYAERINSIREIETFAQLPKEKQKQNRFTIKINQMILEEIEKSKFAQINNKRYYFSDRILSLPFSLPFLKEIVNFKTKKQQKKKMEAFLQQEKHKLIQMEKFAAQKNKRISIYRNILQQKPTFYHLNSLKRSAENNENINFSQNTRSYI